MIALLPEIWGGLAAMLVALPSALAFGVLVFTAVSPELAGQGALTGLVGAAVMGLVAPLVGRTRALISAPCAPAAAVLSGLAYTLAQTGESVTRIPLLLALTALLSSLLQILYGALKGGRLIKYIPYPVVSGYLSGVGLIIALSQLPKLLGLPPGMELFHGLLAPDQWRWQGIVVGLVTIIVMLKGPALTQKVPAAILALAAGIATYFLISLFVPTMRSLADNALVIGPLQSDASFLETVTTRFSLLLQISPQDIQLVAYSALALSALLSIDTLKTCVVLDALTHNRHDSNRELLGQGVANLASFFCGGMPGAGTMGPSLVNVTSGGTTHKSGVMEGVFVVLAIVLLAPLIAWVPIGALAGILLMVAYRMFDWSAFRLMQHRETRLDFFVIAAVVVVAESVGLIAASATGVGMAILLFIRDQIHGTVLRRSASLAETSSKTRRLHEEREVLNREGHLGGIYELQGNLFFGTTDQLFTQLEPDLKRRKWLLFDMRRVQSIDFTAAHLFEQMHERLQERGGRVLFSGFGSHLAQHQDIQQYLARVGVLDDSEKGMLIFETRDEALEWMESAILEHNRITRRDETSPLELSQIELFAEMEPAVLQQLRDCMRTSFVAAGKRVFSAGDTGDELFLIRRGTVRILLPLPGGKLHHLATFSSGDFFGEIAFIDHGARSAHAVAKTDCELYILSRTEFNKRSMADPVLGVKVFARLAKASSQRLRQADIELRTAEDR